MKWRMHNVLTAIYSLDRPPGKLIRMNDLSLIFGERVKARRLELGLSQMEFAMQIGISRPGLSIIEAGRGNPKLKTIEAMAANMGVSPAELLLPLDAPAAHHMRRQRTK